jgi:hypothetical protein
MPPRFDAATLATLGRVQEVQLETTSLDGARTHRTVIWIVTSGDQVFIRSVRGDAGRWYREARRRPEVILHAAGASIPVSLVMADDPDSIRRVSDAFTAKYARVSPASTAAMIASHTLSTTIRVDPR